MKALLSPPLSGSIIVELQGIVGKENVLVGDRELLVYEWPNRMADWLTDSGLLPEPASLAP